MCKFWRTLGTSSPMDIVSCRIMILNIRLGLHGSSCNSNAIENTWHKLKEYIQREIKPKTKQELITGIESFWEIVTKDKCKHIRHLRKVIPKIIDVNSAATGY